MNVGLFIPALGSISNRILASNVRNDLISPDNIQYASIECKTPHQLQVAKLGCDEIVTVAIGLYGMGGFFNAQQCFNSYGSKIEEALMAAEEKACRLGYTLKILYSTIYPTGTSSTVAPLVSYVGKKFNLKPLSMAIVPNYHAPSYQLYNTISCLALLNQPIVLIDENFGQLIPEEIKNRTRHCVDNPSNFYYDGQFSFEFGCTLSNLISGASNDKTKNSISDAANKDDFGFLDVIEESHRNQIVELESAIGGGNGLYVMHYSRSLEPNFEESSILKPGILPSDPRDPLIFCKYDASISEDEVITDITSSFERQQLKPARFYCIPSDKNELIILINSDIPQRLKNLINHVKEKKTLKEVLEKRYRKTILANICPIMRGSEAKILKDRLSKIFFEDESEWEYYWKKQGHTDLDELSKTNFSCFLGKEHEVFLKPLGYEE